MGLETLLLQPSQKFVIHNAVATLPVPSTAGDGQPIPKAAGGPQSLRRLALKIKASVGTATLTGASVFTYVDGEWVKHTIITPDITFAAGPPADVVRLIVVDYALGDRIAVAGTVAGGTFTVTAYPLEVTL